MSLPTEREVEIWLHHLGDTDEKFAQACAKLSACKERLKVAKALATPREGTVQERENAALTSPQYALALDELQKAEYEKTLLHLKREQWILGIDVWRSLNANRRKS